MSMITKFNCKIMISRVLYFSMNILHTSFVRLDNIHNNINLKGSYDVEVMSTKTTFCLYC